jgi:hypothetical protein
MKITKLFKSLIGLGSKKSEKIKNKNDLEKIKNIDNIKEENFHDDLDFLSKK